MIVNIYNALTGKLRKNSWLCRYPWTKQFIKFSIAGGTCMVLDFLIYIGLTRLFSFWANHNVWANFLSVCISATVNFVWNKNWTFRASRNVTAQYFKFWVVVWGGLVVYQALFYVFVDQLHFFDLLGKAIAAAIVWILRFIFNKFWSFK
jgi:putative flippase GtrA